MYPCFNDWYFFPFSVTVYISNTRYFCRKVDFFKKKYIFIKLKEKQHPGLFYKIL